MSGIIGETTSLVRVAGRTIMPVAHPAGAL